MREDVQEQTERADEAGRRIMQEHIVSKSEGRRLMYDRDGKLHPENCYCRAVGCVPVEPQPGVGGQEPQPPDEIRICPTPLAAKNIRLGQHIGIRDSADKVTLPTDAAERKNIPLARGLLDYFPNALAEVARVSRIGNEQHNPGEEMHWAREKSTDHADCILRHMVDRGTEDSDGVLHDAKIAWRALAMLENALIARGAKPGRAAR